MFENTNEEQAKKQILEMVSEYCDTYHAVKPYEEGDRISYARRVYDHSEMVNLVDSSLEFWLTSGRYTDIFEAEFAKYLGVKFCSLVNSGSSANLNAFMALTSPLLKDRRINRGDEVITVAAGFPTIHYGALLPPQQNRWAACTEWLCCLCEILPHVHSKPYRKKEPPQMHPSIVS